MATSDKETLAALAAQVADLQKEISSGGSNDGTDPVVLKTLSAITEQVRVLDKRINESAQAEQRVMQQSDELEEAHRRIAALEEDSRSARIKTVIEDVKIPAFRPYFQALLDVATKETRVVKFTKRDGKQEEMTVEKVVKAFIQELNDSTRTLFKEHMAGTGAHHTRSGDDVDLEDPHAVSSYVDRKTREYMSQFKVTDYSTAMKRVLDSEPEVKQAYIS